MWERIVSLDGLTDAWHDVRASANQEDGTVPGAVRRFEREAEGRLAHLAAALTGGWYRPAELPVHRLMKADGSSRVLHVPPVDDRVVERALLNELAPIIDPTLSPAAHAYRPGRGVQTAAAAIARLRDDGGAWVALSDIDECFPSIGPSRVRAALARYVLPDEVQGLIDRLLFRRAVVRRAGDELRGLPQGSPLSPLFMNLVLADFDELMLDRGCGLVRYADDFALVARTFEDATLHLTQARATLKEMGLIVGEDKTTVTTFDIGFEFLGEDFGPKLPPAEQAEAEPDSPRSVFVGLQGARISAVRGRLIVESPDDAELLNVPLGRVGRLVVAGSVGVSAGARSWAMLNDIPTTFLSRHGTMLGELLPSVSPGRRLRMVSQFSFVQDRERSLEVARVLVCGKVRKQRVVLQRTSRTAATQQSQGALTTMAQALRAASTASSIAELMGHEGAAARAYFAALGPLMPDGLQFDERSRRPPRDLVNGALSYGYAILLGEVTAALHVAGLDPAFGLLHRNEDRESLALDLLEEFRPWVVDRAVTALIARKQLRAEHAHVEEGREGVWLTSEAKAILVTAYEQRMLARANAALPGFSGSVRRCLYRQAQRLALHIQDSERFPFTECAWR